MVAKEITYYNDDYTNESSVLYTLSEAERIINRKKTYEKIRRRNLLGQKICGAVLIVAGCLFPMMLDGDATFSLLTLPLGVALIFTKEKVLL